MDKRDLQSARRRTIQDDRRELGADAEDDSDLVARPDAPLAEEAVLEKDAERQPAPAATPPALLGGAPVPMPESSDAPRSEINAAEDRPIKD